MQPVQMYLANQIRFVLSVVSTQIRLANQDGETDLSKSQEKALLPIINEIYSKKFKNMNEVNANYPGIDYWDSDNKLALQMTSSITKGKVQKTLNTISKYDVDKKIKKLWMFFLTVEATPKNVIVNSKDIEIEYMTLKDIERKITTADLDDQRKYLSLIKREYPSYFQPNSSFSISEKIPVPVDLTIFNNFIKTKEWFPNDSNEGYQQVYNFISSFQECLLNCSYDTRETLAYILEVQGIPSNYNSKVKVYIDNIMGRLNINNDNFDEFEYQLNLLEASNLVDIEEEFQNFDEMTMTSTYRSVVVVSYHSYEPEINLFSVLPKFYIKYHSFDKYLIAIKNADFHLLSDKYSKSKVADISELYDEAPFKNENHNCAFTFIDLFAGIGGKRIPFQQLGGKCVFSSEWNKFAQRTYAANYGEVPSGDITKISATDIPDHDILMGGLPCQAFSQAGLKEGFQDTRGTIFFEIQRILCEKKPKIFLLENIKGLKYHDKGNTLKTIINILTGESDQALDGVLLSQNAREVLGKKLNYWVDFKILTATDFGVPQRRERLFFVGFDKDYFGENFDFEKIFKWPTPSYERTMVGDILESQEILDAQEDKYTISDKLLAAYQHHKGKHRVGYSVYTADSAYTNIITALYYRNSSIILIDQSHLGKNPRKLTPRECARLQGFPDNFIVDAVSQVHMYRLFGNSTCVRVIQAIAKQLVDVLYYKRAEKNTGW